ncbi:MAG: nucleotide exchange factor GrpE [Lachnospiraceae bacterium]|nr:nucleotide exchange factor GrpE [Lachnospiraceae bacterium]
MTEQEKETLDEENMPDNVEEVKDKEAEQETQDEAAGSEETAESESEETEKTDETDAKEESEESGVLKGLKKKKDKKLEALENEKKELSDKLMRQMAEFENYRKRTEKEKATMFSMGARSVIEKILPVVDNLERGLASVPEEARKDSVFEGMNLIYKQLTDELDKIGVKPIEAVGEEFNPNFHNAVMQVESDEYETGVVAQELQKGYTYKDEVVRYSMVAVVQ